MYGFSVSVFEEVEAAWVLIVCNLKNFVDAPASEAYKADPADPKGDPFDLHRSTWASMV